MGRSLSSIVYGIATTGPCAVFMETGCSSIGQSVTYLKPTSAR